MVKHLITDVLLTPKMNDHSLIGISSYNYKIDK